MTSDTPGAVGGPLFFPAPASPAPPPVTADGWEPEHGPAAIRLDPAAITAMAQPERQQLILGMLACLKRRPLTEITAGPAHADGSLALPSMTAVWVLSRIGKAFGRRLVRLSDPNLDRDSLRSVAGLARLIGHAIAPQTVAGAA